MTRTAVAVALLCVAPPVAAADPDGFVPLFDGKTLAGWKAVAKPQPDGKPGDPSATWAVADGVVRCTGKPNGYLATEKEYGDYTLRLKWRYTGDGKTPNSGVLLHITGPDRYWPLCLEAQTKAGFAGDIWLNPDAKGVLPTVDIPAAQFDTADPNKRHYFRLASDPTVEKAVGAWNEYEIVTKAGAVTLRVNGTVVNAATGGSLKRGRIGLQSEGSPVEFKDVAIKRGG